MKHTVTFAFLLLALVLYARGLVAPGHAFLVLGIVAECVFWWRVMQWRRGRRRNSES